MADGKAVKRGLRFVLPLVAIVLACAWISANRVQLMLIRGDSMMPSYHNMQLVALDKHSREFQTGDVIAFRCEGLSTILVKRIAACGGDTAQIVDGTLLVNGEASALYEEGVFDRAGRLAKEIRPAQGEYLVIGDHVAGSRDSRDEAVGNVREEDIIGKIIC